MRRLNTAVLSASFLTLCFGAAHGESLDAKGRALINELGCKACHVFDGQGGQVGPSLDTVGSRLKAAEIRQQVRDAKERNPKSIMPSFSHLDADSLDTLAEFLSRQKGGASQ
jgi:ubiquinol-cytochrome c reductase cytochrome b subunit